MPTALSTDLYELTMAAGYYGAGMNDLATFELYVRDLPPHRSFLVAAGLDQALDHIERLRFTGEEIAYLRQTPNLKGVPPAFFDEYLRSFHFTGDVWAIEEGTPVFPHEPLLRVRAPIIEAQVIETALLAMVTFETSVASKAARVVEAAAGRPVIEFGSRRAHGVGAALHAARAAYLGGCDGTSNVEAGFRYHIPVSGTMAHSWVMAFGDELEAFRQYASLYGDRAVLLLDTYDVVEAARRVVSSGLRPSAIRLDSGDIAELSRVVRGILDEGGLKETGIFVSGDLDEYRIAELLERGAEVNGFGVGTALATSNDAPALGGIYKLVEIRRGGSIVPTMKLSPGKLSYPGCKQAWRVHENGTAAYDVLAVCGEDGPPGGVPLVKPVMAGGRRAAPAASLADLRARCRRLVAELPVEIRVVDGSPSYRVAISERLGELTRKVAGMEEGSPT
jgi:nicotinate phosphoribosyltransferase